MTFQEINAFAQQYRGVIINSVIQLERVMDGYLAQYFFPSDEARRAELMLLILSGDKLTFGSKLQILNFIVKNKGLDLYDIAPNIPKDLTTIMETRNILAHLMVDLSEDSMKLPLGTVRFLKIKNNLQTVEFSVDSINEFITKIDAIKLHIVKKLDQ